MSARRSGWAAVALLLAGAAHAGGSIIIVNADDPDEGFNDTTPVAAEAGNSGTTRGQQRLNVFQAAAAVWEASLQPNQSIRVIANFNPLTCDSMSATLGSAGADDIYRDFAGAPFASTWYHAALAEHISNSSLNGNESDIGAEFNSTIDEGTCLNGSTWYYGINAPTPDDRTALFPVVLHELGHGLGFSGFANLANGQFPNQNLPDVFSQFTRDLDLDLNWPQMSDQERALSAVNDPAVVWTGNAVTAGFPQFLDGTPLVRINAPGVISGDYATIEASDFDRIPGSGVTRDVVLLDDGTGVSSNDGCELADNFLALQDRIVLVVESDACSFIQAAINLGLGFDNGNFTRPAALLVAAMDGTDPADVDIQVGNDPGDFVPVFGISNQLGNDLIANNGSANASILFDNNIRRGTISDAEFKSAGLEKGFPYYLRLNAPGQLSQGSSVYHWTTDAEPSLLMEPDLTDEQFNTLDLTTSLMQDIGWGGASDVILISGFELE